MNEITKINKPDVIVSWPRNCDYPLWREMIKENRNRFNQIIVVITETNQGFDYSKFVEEELMGIAYVIKSPPVMPGEDWRNVAVNFGLAISNSPSILFTEQDFYPKQSMWDYLENNNLGGVSVVAAFQEERLHPCFILITRELLETTRKDFGIIPNVADHFCKIQEDLKSENILRLSAEDYEHLNGLSHNFTLITNGQMPNYQSERFLKYIQDCLMCGENLHEEFRRVCKEYLLRLKENASAL